MQNLLKECIDVKKALYVCIEEMRDCIYTASRVYRYCTSWPLTVVKHKAKIDVIGDELSSLGKSFDFLDNKDGEKRKRINSLQVKLLYLQR